MRSACGTTRSPEGSLVRMQFRHVRAGMVGSQVLFKRPGRSTMLCKVLCKLMWESYYHWICIFVVFTPTVVQTLNKCNKIDVCKCSTDEGTIDLWSLAGTTSNTPRFKDISVKGGSGSTVDWNPCNKWTAKPPESVTTSNCQDIAVCFKFGNSLLADIGEQDAADFSFNSTSGTCVLSLTGKAIPGPGNPSSSSTHITLQCDPHEEGRLESAKEPVAGNDDFQVLLTLYSKYACPSKSGLSIGSVLIIIFFSLLVVYLVAGILFNKYRKGATGKELIPNVNFWTDFPLLVKDGVVFSYQCCKNVCSRQRGSYESI